MSIKKLFTAFCCVLLLSICTTVQASTQPSPYIIDTDMDYDDWMGILYLLKNKDVDVKAITIVGTGASSCEAGAKNAEKLIKLANHKPIPVACGATKPMHGKLIVNQTYRNSVDKLYGIELEDGPKPSGQRAEKVIVSVLNNSNEPVTIIAMGPLSNIQRLFYGANAPKDKIKRLYISGGAIHSAGNIRKGNNNGAEWNMYADPFSAFIVFRSGVPITLVPLDATNQVPISHGVYNTLMEQEHGKVAKFIDDVIAKERASGLHYFYDPLAAVYATNPKVAYTKPMNIKIYLQPGPDYGRLFESPEGEPMDVVMTVRSGDFLEQFAKVINQG